MEPSIYDNMLLDDLWITYDNAVLAFNYDHMIELRAIIGQREFENRTFKHDEAVQAIAEDR